MKKRDLKLGDFSGDDGETGLEGGLSFGDFLCPLPHNPTAVVSFVLTDFMPRTSLRFSQMFS